MSVEQRLYSLINYERGFAKYQAENYIPGKVGALLSLLRVPFENLSFVHIAGTKGKGSTAHFLSALLMAGGHRVGLFTSPHLFRVNERIRINGASISDKDLNQLLDRYEDDIKKNGLTFFDALTFLATVYFYEQQCNYVVFETGLGGRLDSTNFIIPKLSILTPVSLDHTALLGNTLTKIAGEKAGIIKSGVPVLSASQEPTVLAVFKAYAENLGSPFFYFEDKVSYHIVERSPEGSSFHAQLHWQGETHSFYVNHLDQIGDVFVRNFLLAALATLVIGNALTSDIVSQASKIRIPARIQLVGHSVIDVSHNDSSLRELFQTLEKYFKGYVFHLMIGIIADKEIELVASEIRKKAFLFKYISVFDFEHPRKSGGKKLFTLLNDLENCSYYSSIEDLKPDPTLLNVLTGSFYTVAPYMRLFFDEKFIDLT